MNAGHGDTLLTVDAISKHFRVGGYSVRSAKHLKAVDEVTLSIRQGETLSLVGESGCGKSTLARLILGLVEPTAGTVSFMGERLPYGNQKRMLGVRRHMQIVFQNPFASLNPRKSIGQILSQPYRVHEPSLSRRELRGRIDELLETVGLTPSVFRERYPHELSGGQRQRVGIARATALRPKFIVADEPVSALDMSVRAQILNLMKDLQSRYGLTYLFITHDLSVVRSISSRVAVMYLGKVVELGPVEQVFSAPLHPYTKALLAATPVPDPRKARARARIVLQGDVPSPVNPPSGCRFHTRCPERLPVCSERAPAPTVSGSGTTVHEVACWLHTPGAAHRSHQDHQLENQEPQE